MRTVPPKRMTSPAGHCPLRIQRYTTSGETRNVDAISLTLRYLGAIPNPFRFQLQKQSSESKRISSSPRENVGSFDGQIAWPGSAPEPPLARCSIGPEDGARQPSCQIRQPVQPLPLSDFRASCRADGRRAWSSPVNRVNRPSTVRKRSKLDKRRLRMTRARRAGGEGPAMTVGVGWQAAAGRRRRKSSRQPRNVCSFVQSPGRPKAPPRSETARGSRNAQESEIRGAFVPGMDRLTVVWQPRRRFGFTV
jgi:hypothetical protein